MIVYANTALCITIHHICVLSYATQIYKISSFDSNRQNPIEI